MFNLCSIVSMSRLSIEIEPEQHRQIKTLATFEGLSIKDYILQKTLYMGAHVEEDTTEFLLSSPKNVKRLKESLETPESEHLVFESLDDLRDALGV